MTLWHQSHQSYDEMCGSRSHRPGSLSMNHLEHTGPSTPQRTPDCWHCWSHPHWLQDRDHLGSRSNYIDLWSLWLMLMIMMSDYDVNACVINVWSSDDLWNYDYIKQGPGSEWHLIWSWTWWTWEHVNSHMKFQVRHHMVSMLELTHHNDQPLFPAGSATVWPACLGPAVELYGLIPFLLIHLRPCTLLGCQSWNCTKVIQHPACHHAIHRLNHQSKWSYVGIHAAMVFKFYSYDMIYDW